MKDAERQLRFTQSVGPAGLDLYFYDPEADTLDLRTASRKLPKLSPGCFFYVVRRDMQPAHEDGDSNADPELVKLMKRGKAQQPVQAATSSDSAQLSSLVEVLRLQVQTSVGAALASAARHWDCNTARDVVRLLWDEPIEGSGGEYTPETCPRAWLFLKKCGGGTRKTHDTLSRLRPLLTPFDKKDLSHLQSLTRCKKEIYFHNIENILCILRMRKAEQEVPDDHYKLEGISRPGILDVADFILGTHKLTAMEENVAGWMDGKDKVDSGEYKATGAKRKANCKKKQEIEHHDSCEEPARKVAEQKGKARVRAPPTDEESDEEDDVEDKLEDDNESGNEDEDEGEDEGEDEDEDAEAASSRKRNRKAETKGQEAKQEKQKAGKRKKQEKEMEKEAKKPKAAAMTEKEKGKAAAAKKAAAEKQAAKTAEQAAAQEKKEAEKKAKEKEKAAAAKKAAAEKEAAKTKAQAEAAAAAQERKAAEKKLKEKDKAVAAEKLAEAPAEKSRKKRKAAYELAAEPIIPNPRQLPPLPKLLNPGKQSSFRQLRSKAERAKAKSGGESPLAPKILPPARGRLAYVNQETGSNSTDGGSILELSSKPFLRTEKPLSLSRAQHFIREQEHISAYDAKSSYLCFTKPNDDLPPGSEQVVAVWDHQPGVTSHPWRLCNTHKYAQLEPRLAAETSSGGGPLVVVIEWPRDDPIIIGAAIKQGDEVVQYMTPYIFQPVKQDDGGRKRGKREVVPVAVDDTFLDAVRTCSTPTRLNVAEGAAEDARPQLSRPILRTDKKLYVQPSPEDGGGVVDVNHARSTEREHTILVPFDQSKTAYGQAPGRVLHFDTSTVYYVQYAQVELDWDAEYELFLALQHEETDAEGEMTFALRNGPAVTVGKVEDRRTFRRSISYRPHPRPLRGEISDFNEGTVEGKDNWWHKWDIFMLKK
eukprot:tig00001250_g7794.t1